jgi:hypothetical protein
MRKARALAGCIAAAASIASGAWASSGATRFFSAQAGVGLETPAGWSLSLHTGYPNVLCVLIHPGGSRISLAADGTAAKNAAALVESSRSGFDAQGLAVDRVSPGPLGGLLLDARAPRHNQALRQLYLVRNLEGGRDPRQAIILTLTTTPDELAAASGTLDWVIAHLDLQSPVRPDDLTSRPDGGM